MRRALAGALVVFAVIGGLATNAGAVDRAKTRRPGPVRVLLMGDSITDSYQARVAELLDGYAVTGAGVKGSGLLDPGAPAGPRAVALRKLVDPDIVVVEYTGNYRVGQVPAYGSAKFLRQWATATRRVSQVFRAWGARVVWVQVPAAAQSGFVTVIPQLNPIYRAQGETVDAWTAFGGATYNAGLHVPDGLHLNSAGVDVLARVIAEQVR